MNTYSRPLVSFNVNENSDDASCDTKGEIVKVVNRSIMANSNSIQTKYYNKDMQLMSMPQSGGRINRLIQQQNKIANLGLEKPKIMLSDYGVNIEENP